MTLRFGLLCCLFVTACAKATPADDTPPPDDNGTVTLAVEGSEDDPLQLDLADYLSAGDTLSDVTLTGGQHAVTLTGTLLRYDPSGEYNSLPLTGKAVVTASFHVK